VGAANNTINSSGNRLGLQIPCGIKQKGFTSK